MPYKINDQQITAVSLLDAPKRYEHFLSRVTDWAEVWTLKGESGFVGMGDDNGNQGIPFWPHPRYAELHAKGDWASFQPTAISLADFMEKWLTGMVRDNLKVVVFPTPNMKGIVVEPARVRAELSERLEEL